MNSLRQKPGLRVGRLVAALIVALSALLSSELPSGGPPFGVLRAEALVGGPPTQGASAADSYALPQPGHAFVFPRDYGSHPEFRIEWWYVTGHLHTAAGRRFGFEATFFRLAAPRESPSPAGGQGNSESPSGSAFGSNQLFLTHMAVTDVQTGHFLWDEKLNREGWDAGAGVGHLELHNEGWSLSATGTTQWGPKIRIVGGIRAEAAFTLDLTPAKPLVVFGENGVSRKGAEAGAASYYLTFSRLAARGTLTVGGHEDAVEGEAWMDHEISSSQLGRGQVGWDWLCVQFDYEPRELMLYRLRHADGSADPVSRLQWVTTDGRAVTADYRWTVLSTWRSPANGAVYPARVLLEARDPEGGLWRHWLIEPLIPDQELRGQLGGGPYWEGACRVLDDAGNQRGSAYMELTGYAGTVPSGGAADGLR